MLHAEWGFLIATDLFFGGLSAGLFLLSAAVLFIVKGDEPRYPNVARWGAILAPWPIMAATAILLFDLGHWYRFYILMLHFRPLSPMSLGTWVLSCFIGVGLVYCYSWLSDEERARLFSFLPQKLDTLQRFNRDLSPLRRVLALLGAPLAIGAVLYPSFMLGVMPSRPFWNTSLLIPVFLFSAFTAGSALLILVAQAKSDEQESRFLYGVFASALAIELAVLAVFVLFGLVSLEPVHDAIRLILGGPFTLWFWVGLVAIGIIAPLATIAVALLRPRPRFVFVSAAAMALIGAYLLRCVFVFVGQASAIE